MEDSSVATMASSDINQDRPRQRRSTKNGDSQHRSDPSHHHIVRQVSSHLQQARHCDEKGNASSVASREDGVVMALRNSTNHHKRYCSAPSDSMLTTQLRVRDGWRLLDLCQDWHPTAHQRLHPRLPRCSLAPHPFR